MCTIYVSAYLLLPFLKTRQWKIKPLHINKWKLSVKVNYIIYVTLHNF